MLRFLQTFLLILITIISVTAKQTDKLVSLYKVQNLHDDLDYIKESLIKYHPNLYTYQSQNDFESSFKEAKEQIIQPLTENEFYKIVKPLVSAIRCSHTELYFSNNYISTHIPAEYPIDVVVKGEEIFVKSSETHLIPVGSKIYSINDKPSKEIILQLEKYISSDGMHLSGREYWLSHYFFKLYEEILKEAPSLYIKFEHKEELKKIRLTPKCDQNVPIPQLPLLDIEYSSFQNQTTANLRVRSFDKVLLKQEGYHYKKYLKKVFNEIEKKKVDKLTIDLRDNFGGNDVNAIELYSYISKKPFKFYEKLSLKKGSKKFLSFPLQLFFPLKKDKKDQMKVYNGHKGLKFLSPKKSAYSGELEILINGGTMSAATHFVAKCHNSERAIIAGRTSGGAYTHSNSGFTIYRKTPNTRLQLFIPAIRYDLYLPNKISSKGGVVPDIIIDEFEIEEKSKSLLTTGS